MRGDFTGVVGLRGVMGCLVGVDARGDLVGVAGEGVGLSFGGVEKEEDCVGVDARGDRRVGVDGLGDLLGVSMSAG